MGASNAPPSELRTAAEIEALAAALLPGMPLFAEGVSHVAAGVAREGRLELFRVDHPSAPRSRWDRFLLDLSRLRAEAIVITGKILRDEPRLSYAFDAGWAGACRTLRRDLGLRERPLLVVLTRAGVDPHHPVFVSGVESLVLRDARSLAHAIQIVRDRGARSISIEAGPQVAAELYAEDSPLDELLFHRFEAALPEEALVGAFATEGGVVERLGQARSIVAVRDGATRSTVERYALRTQIPLPRGL
jgi:hypothetical protein